MHKIFTLMAGVFFLVGICSVSFAETGVTETEVVLGQVAALSGPAQALGRGMKAGMNAYFASINDQGGVNGRKIRLTAYDDGYEPIGCIEQTKKLLNEGVFALIGYVGTPTAKVAVPIAEDEKIPFIGPFTGAEFLRNPVKHYVMNIRGSYFDETEGLVAHLVNDLGINKLACFYQNDSYGQAGFEGVKRAMEKRGLSLVAEGTYERNTLAVKGALARIKSAEPQAIIMIGAYAPCAEFIKLAKKIGMKDVKYCNISFVGSDALAQELGSEGDGVIISQVVPFPFDTSLPLVAEYQRLLKKYSPDQPVGFVSLEGFMVAKAFVEALKSAGGEPTKESLISAFEGMGNLNLGGVTLSFSPGDHQGMDEIRYTVIEGGAFKDIKSFK